VYGPVSNFIAVRYVVLEKKYADGVTDRHMRHPYNASHVIKHLETVALLQIIFVEVDECTVLGMPQHRAFPSELSWNRD
jgi:hypothetical protein